MIINLAVSGAAREKVIRNKRRLVVCLLPYPLFPSPLSPAAGSSADGW